MIDYLTTLTLAPGSPERHEVACLVTTPTRAHIAWVDLRLFEASTKTLYQLRAAMNCRSWGTSEGVTQLAVTGPTGETVTDAPCDAWALPEICGIRSLSPAALAAWHEAGFPR